MYDNPEFDNPQQEGMIVGDNSTLSALNRAEVDVQIATAKRYPRSVKKFITELEDMVTLTEETASECIYALPRDGKTLVGPSARFAELVASSWGNSRAGARVVSEEGDFITAQGAFHDLEKNVAITFEVKRRIVDRNGKRYKPDMVGVTGNAACSVAFRNAVLRGVPKALWKKAYDAAQRTIAGDQKTLAERREAAVRAFAAFRVTEDMICTLLEVKGMADIGTEHLVVLRGVLTALKEGDSTVEQLFSTQNGPSSEIAAKSADRLQQIKDQIKKQVEVSGDPNPQSASGQPVSAPAPAEVQSPHRSRTRTRVSSVQEAVSVSTETPQPAFGLGVDDDDLKMDWK